MGKHSSQIAKSKLAIQKKKTMKWAFITIIIIIIIIIMFAFGQALQNFPARPQFVYWLVKNKKVIHKWIVGWHRMQPTNQPRGVNGALFNEIIIQLLLEYQRKELGLWLAMIVDSKKLNYCRNLHYSPYFADNNNSSHGQAFTE